MPYEHIAKGYVRSIILWIPSVRRSTYSAKSSKAFGGICIPIRSRQPLSARLRSSHPQLPDGLDAFTFFTSRLLEYGFLLFY